ncbi:hypothetical protein [Streptomyces leeuwenhoekii]|uniref:hypothetical protein n=1 Tax=Streptomyces leeuwenhoekii TaxID=1437453 RepID=UPI0012FEFB71
MPLPAWCDAPGHGDTSSSRRPAVSSAPRPATTAPVSETTGSVRKTVSMLPPA